MAQAYLTHVVLLGSVCYVAVGVLVLGDVGITPWALLAVCKLCLVDAVCLDCSINNMHSTCIERFKPWAP